MPPIADDIRQRATRIKLACFDVDGTLTDGRLFFDEQGRESKAFHVLDGQGLVLLRRCGIEVALITARNSLVAQARGRDLGVQTFIHAKDKLAQVQQLCAQMQISLEQVAFMGDDLPDLTVLREVGLAVAPANAHHWVTGSVHWQTRARGGEGAARELCDLLLDTQGHTEGLLGGAHP
mgnify:FL=1